MMKNNRLKALLLVSTISLASFAGCGTNADNSSQNEEVDAAAEEETINKDFSDLSSFTAKTADGSTFTQDDFAKADLTVINVWGTTCGPCVDEMPSLAAFEKALPDNVNLMTFCLDGEYDPDSMNAILKDSGFEGVTIVNGDGDLETFTSEIVYTPTTVFVDSKGKMVTKAIIGADPELEAGYTKKINKALSAMGKEPISK